MNDASHNGPITELYLSLAQGNSYLKDAHLLPSWTLLPRQLNEVELLQNGALSPLDGFMDARTYRDVLHEMRLPDGVFWPLPITLDITERFAASIEPGTRIALRDAEGVLIAILELRDLFTPDPEAEAIALFGTRSPEHPGVAQLLERTHPIRAGGRLVGVAQPRRYAFTRLRATPRQLRDELSTLETSRTVGFHTRGLMHRPHRDALAAVARHLDAALLIHPALDSERSDHGEQSARVRCYERALVHYPETLTLLRLVELGPRWAGAREAAMHALVRRNFGCTHFVIEPRQYLAGEDEPSAARFVKQLDAIRRDHGDGLGIALLTLDEGRRSAGEGAAMETVSDDALGRLLADGREPPQSLVFPEVLEELHRIHPPRHRQGFTVFFTGLSGAGKSTVAQALLLRLAEQDQRHVTLLDGDLVRTRLSSELGFSREHRDLNVLRIGYVASEITKHGGIAICAPIAPYAASRRQVREMIEAAGGFIEVHVSTPLRICEERDRKGLYAKAHAGLLKGMTGIDDPYEEPRSPELRIDTSTMFPAQAVDRIIGTLRFLGYLPQEEHAEAGADGYRADRAPGSGLLRRRPDARS